MINRLSRILVNNGFGDLKVKVGDSEITCVRSILMNGNDTIRKLLLDDQKSEVLELYERCEINSFLEIEKYYSGGCMELNENNVCDILRFSIYYNDNRIMLICKKYLKTHMTESIIGEIFSILNGLNIQKLNDLKGICEDYIKLNGYNYLNEDSLLLKLNLNSIQFILNNKRLIIDDENWLLNRLLLWYREVLKSKAENEVEREEEREEFISIIKSQINLNEIIIKEVSEENLQELNNLKISINENVKNHIKIKLKEVNSVELKIIIHKYYLKEMKIEEMKIENNDLEKLRNEEIKNEMIKLLSNEDIKIVEIVLIIIMEMRIVEIIPKEIKNKLLGVLMGEYVRNKRNLTLKCLCLFVDNKKYISTIEDLFGKEILYQILNEEYYLNQKSKELLIKYIREMKLNEKEKEEMSKILLNKELSKELLVKEINSFSYPQSEYSYVINEEMSLIPSFDGDKCEFSISPPLPYGLTIDKENGEINGVVDNEIEKREYKIVCKNKKNEKKFKLSLEIIEIKFTELNKGNNISISNNEKLMTKINNGWNHCYLNLKMENGIYHIKYQFHQNGSSNINRHLGLSTDNTYSGTGIFNQPTTCNYYTQNGKSYDITQCCHIGTVVNSNPNFNDCGDGSINEIIVDMNKREFWISHNNSSPVLLVKDLPSPLFPYVQPYGQHASIELLSVSHQS